MSDRAVRALDVELELAGDDELERMRGLALADHDLDPRAPSA